MPVVVRLDKGGRVRLAVPKPATLGGDAGSTRVRGAVATNSTAPPPPTTGAPIGGSSRMFAAEHQPIEPPSSPCASIADDSGVHARMPASTAMAAARRPRRPRPASPTTPPSGVERRRALPNANSRRAFVHRLALLARLVLEVRAHLLGRLEGLRAVDLAVDLRLLRVGQAVALVRAARTAPVVVTRGRRRLGRRELFADGGKDARFLRPEGLTPPITSAGCDAPSFDASPLSPIARYKPSATRVRRGFVRFAQT